MDIHPLCPGERIRPDCMTVDHVIPRTRGGSDSKDNKVLACHACNNLKGGKTLVEFEASRVELIQSN